MIYDMDIFKKDRADWVIVLEAMYDMQLSTNIDLLVEQTEERHPNPEQKDRLIKMGKLNYDLHEEVKSVSDSIEYLKSVGLVEEVGPVKEGEYEINGSTIPYKPTFGLSQEGLQLAHQIKAEKQTRKTNIILSGGIILVSLLTLVAQLI